MVNKIMSATESASLGLSITHRNFLEKAAHETYILERLYNNVECSLLFYSTEWNICAAFAMP